MNNDTCVAKKILVVDDEPDVRNFLAACIEDAGFNVETATDGIDALEKIQANIPESATTSRTGGMRKAPKRGR